MKNTLFISTYYNNPHFIELQQKSFKMFVQDEFDFTILDDSEDNTRTILSGNLARDEIRNECIRLGVNHISVPQTIHAYERFGGYVPNENESTNHPTERHQALLRWIFKNYKSLGFDQYKTLALMDADVLFKAPINMSTYMDYDIIGTGRIQSIALPLGQFPDERFPAKAKAINGQTIDFFTFYIIFINLQKVTNLETLDIGSWPATDTGSRSHFFIKENPQYSYSYLNERHDAEFRIDVISKYNNFEAQNAEFIHYRAGSNWNYENSTYYKEKLSRMLKSYIPQLANNGEEIHNLVSRDGFHVLK